MGRSKIFLVTILTLLANLYSWQSPPLIEVGASPEDLSSVQVPTQKNISPSMVQYCATKPQTLATYTQIGSRWLRLSASSYGKSLGIHPQNFEPGKENSSSLIQKASTWGEEKLNLGKTKLASKVEQE